MTRDPALRDGDETALAAARSMLRRMRHASLAVLLPEGDSAGAHPYLSRILCQTDGAGIPVALLSGIALHSRALAADPRAALMIAPPQPKGDPMTWPRLSLQVVAEPLPPNKALTERWLRRHPRSTLYLGLPDFRFWRLTPRSGLLNAGFGAAVRLEGSALAGPDMRTPPRG